MFLSTFHLMSPSNDYIWWLKMEDNWGWLKLIVVFNPRTCFNFPLLYSCVPLLVTRCSTPTVFGTMWGNMFPVQTVQETVSFLVTGTSSSRWTLDNLWRSLSGREDSAPDSFNTSQYLSTWRMSQALLGLTIRQFVFHELYWFMESHLIVLAPN